MTVRYVYGAMSRLRAASDPPVRWDPSIGDKKVCAVFPGGLSGGTFTIKGGYLYEHRSAQDGEHVVAREITPEASAEIALRDEEVAALGRSLAEAREARQDALARAAARGKKVKAPK